MKLSKKQGDWILKYRYLVAVVVVITMPLWTIPFMLYMAVTATVSLLTDGLTDTEG